MGWKSPTQALPRLAPARRYPVLVACLQPALRQPPDVAGALLAQGVWGCHREAKQAWEEFRTAGAHSTHAKLPRLRELGTVLRDDAIEAPNVRAVSFERGPNQGWHEAMEETPRVTRPRPEEAMYCFGKRYRSRRPLVPLWLQTRTLRAQGPGETGLRAVEVSRDLDRAPTRRPVPKDAPMALVPDAWRPSIREPDGASRRRDYALGTRWHLRSA